MRSTTKVRPQSPGPRPSWRVWPDSDRSRGRAGPFRASVFSRRSGRFRSAGDHLAVAVDPHILRAIAMRNRDPTLHPATLALNLGVDGLAIRLLLCGRKRLLQRGARTLWHTKAV